MIGQIRLEQSDKVQLIFDFSSIILRNAEVRLRIRRSAGEVLERTRANIQK